MERDKILYLLIAGSAIIFGTMEAALKLAGAGIDPFQITVLRFLIGGLVLLPFAIHECRGREKGFITKRLWLKMFFLGILSVPLCMVLFQLGVFYSNAATSAVIFCSNPVFTMLFAHIMTTDDKLNRRKVLALALGAVGLIFMIRPWNMQAGNTLIGMLFSLIAAILWGFYGVVASKTIAQVGALTQTSVSILFGAFLLLCLMPPLERPILDGVSENIVIILYASVIVTGLGYLLYFLAVKRSSAAMASTAFFLKPVIAPIFAVILLDETITYNMYIGIGLVLAASWILIFRKKGSSVYLKDEKHER